MMIHSGLESYYWVHNRMPSTLEELVIDGTASSSEVLRDPRTGVTMRIAAHSSDYEDLQAGTVLVETIDADGLPTYQLTKGRKILILPSSR